MPRPTPLALVSAIVVHRCVKPFFPLLTPFLSLSVCAAPSGGAAAEEGKDALCAIDVDPSFDFPGANGMDAADRAAVVAGWGDDEGEGAWVGGGGGRGGGAWGTLHHYNGCSALAPLHAGCHKHGEAARDLFCGRRRQ